MHNLAAMQEANLQELRRLKHLLKETLRLTIEAEALFGRIGREPDIFCRSLRITQEALKAELETVDELLARKVEGNGRGHVHLRGF
jgi:hypothetical protein